MALISRQLSHWAALIPIILASALALAGLFSHRREAFSLDLLLDPYLHNILQFSLKQAAISCLLAILLAYPIARILLYFPTIAARRLYLSMCALAFVMPSFILITGIIILLGAEGWLLPLLGDNWKLFGWNGILIAHVYLNMPLAIRVLYQGLASVPSKSWRLSQQMRQSPWQRWKHIEWHAIKPQLVLLTAFIFVICFNSFGVILALGGGPKATTIEVAVYQALKFDYNLSEALLLSFIQTLIAGSVLLFAGYAGKSNLFQVARITPQAPVSQRLLSKTIAHFIYLIAWIFLLLPIVAVFLKAIMSQSLIDWLPLVHAATRSIIIATSAAILAVTLGWLVMLPIRSNQAGSPKRALLAEWLAVHHMIIPAMVIGVGWFAFFITRIDINQYSLVFLILLNAFILTPFVVLQLKPMILQWDKKHRRLLSNWRPSLWQRLSIEARFILPALKPTLGLVLVFALGDVPIFALFGDPNEPTLTWLIYRLAGSYRMDMAAQVSLVLLAISVILIFKMEPRHAQHK